MERRKELMGSQAARAGVARHRGHWKGSFDVVATSPGAQVWRGPGYEEGPVVRGRMETSRCTPCCAHGGAAQARRWVSAPKVTPRVWSGAASTTWGGENKLRMDTEVIPQEDKLMAGQERAVMGERVGSRQWVNGGGSKLDGKTKAW